MKLCLEQLEDRLTPSGLDPFADQVFVSGVQRTEQLLLTTYQDGLVIQATAQAYNIPLPVGFTQSLAQLNPTMIEIDFPETLFSWYEGATVDQALWADAGFLTLEQQGVI